MSTWYFGKLLQLTEKDMFLFAGNENDTTVYIFMYSIIWERGRNY